MLEIFAGIMSTGEASAGSVETEGQHSRLSADETGYRRNIADCLYLMLPMTVKLTVRPLAG